MSKIVTASQARAELFGLMDEVASSPDKAVVVRRRGKQEGVALVREGYLRYLEARVQAMETQAAHRPFKLIGSMQVSGDVEEILRESRMEQHRLFEEKMKRWDGDE